MSDEPRVLQAADVYNATHDLPLYEWVASLESQNQALQEEVDRLRHVVRHESPDMISCSCGATRHGIAVENQALQEALRNIADICHGWAGPEAAASNAMRLASVAAFARSALSPTQETDPG